MCQLCHYKQRKLFKHISRLSVREVGCSTKQTFSLSQGSFQFITVSAQHLYNSHIQYIQPFHTRWLWSTWLTSWGLVVSFISCLYKMFSHKLAYTFICFILEVYSRSAVGLKCTCLHWLLQMVHFYKFCKNWNQNNQNWKF